MLRDHLQAIDGYFVNHGQMIVGAPDGSWAVRLPKHWVSNWTPPKEEPLWK